MQNIKMCRQVSAKLQKASVLGIDVEAALSASAASSPRPCLLQVRSRQLGPESICKVLECESLIACQCQGRSCIAQSSTMIMATGQALSRLPICRPGQPLKGSWLQIATPSEVLIYDLLALNQHQALLNECLTPIFKDSSIIKIGVGLAEDLKRLCKAYPSLSVFQRVTGLRDLR